MNEDAFNVRQIPVIKCPHYEEIWYEEENSCEPYCNIIKNYAYCGGNLKQCIDKKEIEI
jgi:hypothetical protein